jgi:hypothetical protein
MHPHHDDVIVRQVRQDGAASVTFLLGTSTAPDQFTVLSRDAAVSQALAFAKRVHVRAWFASGTDPDGFVLLGTFRAAPVDGAGSSVMAKSAARKTDDDAAPSRRGTRIGNSVTETPLDDLAQRIRAEFLEMPGMYLTGPHIQRLCGVERSPCQASLDALVETKFLRVLPDGTYARRTEGADVAPPRPTNMDLGTRKALPKPV